MDRIRPFHRENRLALSRLRRPDCSVLPNRRQRLSKNSKNELLQAEGFRRVGEMLGVCQRCCHSLPKSIAALQAPECPKRTDLPRESSTQRPLDGSVSCRLLEVDSKAVVLVLRAQV